MKHLGDITKINGYDAPVVDCIIGGSPCQDLSVAGKRAGLDGERSGLFMEQLRIIKEMRKKDENNGRAGVNIRPRYMVWENVPGAFSSNKGEDFRGALEETAKIADKDAVIPSPPKGKWTNCGSIVGDGWSIAWRILNAQFWGVPQRRRRIALVADFGGESAPEILFVRQGVSGHFEPSQQKRQGTSTNAEGGIGAADREGVFCFEPGAAKRLGGYVWEGLAPTLRTEVGDNRPSVAYTLKIGSGCEGGGKGALIQTNKSATLSTLQDQTLFQPVYSGKNAQFDFEISDKGVNSPLVAKGPGAVCYSVDQGGGKSACNVQEGTSPTLTCTHGGEPAVCYGIGFYHSNAWKSENPHSGVYEADTAKTLDSNTCGYPGCNQGGIAVVQGSRTRYIVRRLTPLECERLQGYPDGWTDIGDWTDSKGKVHKSSDASRYKALGNSIALPPWKWVLKRICACYERDATMASLFDGIGGFPYLWEQLNGKGTCLWASEIEEFPMAVTKVRIG